MKLRFVITLFLIFWSMQALAFTVVFKSGKKVEGTWYSEETTTIRIKDKDGRILSFNKSSLDLQAMSLFSRNFVKTSRVSFQKTIALAAEAREEQVEVVNAQNGTSTPLSGQQPSPVTTRAAGKLWNVAMDISNVFDSNVNHDEESVDSYGLVYGITGRLQNRTENPSLEMRYSIARHSYTETEQWDRISHNLQVTYEKRFARSLRMELEGEIAIKGSSEDREIGNQYIVGPLLRYRIAKRTEIGAYGVYRLKRYEDDPLRNAVNRYAGVLFIQKFGKSRVELDYRYETNDSEGDRSKYTRNTYAVQYSTFLRNQVGLAFSARYRPKTYLNRYIEIEVDNGPDYEVQRYDRQWVFSIDVAIALGRDFQLLPSYQFETRNSNDVDKNFSAHLPSVALRYQW